MFIAPLSTITKTWKQLKCPQIDKWMQKMQCINTYTYTHTHTHTHTREYHSALKKNEIMPFAATWMQPEVIILSERSQKDKYRMIITYIQNLNYNTNESIYATETESGTQRTDWRLPRERGVKRTGLRVWDQQMQTDTCRTDKQQDPTVSDVLY